jgi:hypothetical protein
MVALDSNTTHCHYGASMQSQTLLGIARHLRALADLIEGDSATRTPAPPPLPALASVGADGHATLGLVERFLHARGVSLVATRAPGAVELALLPLAQHIASTHPRCEPLIHAVKRVQGTARPVRLNLCDLPQEHVAAMTQLGAQAARAQLLPGYRYRKSPVREIVSRPPKTPEAIAFFTGQWLEIHLFDVAVHLATAAGWELACGVIVRLPDNDRFELDLVAAAPDGRALVVEAKTTDSFADDVPKFRRLTQVLGLAPEDAMLVAPSLDEWSLIAAATQAGMTAVRLDMAARALQARITPCADPAPSAG